MEARLHALGVLASPSSLVYLRIKRNGKRAKAMKKGGNWTPEQDALLKLALAKKTSVQRLAVRFNVSESAIKSRARALGLDLPARPKMQKTERSFRWVAKRPRSISGAAPQD